MLARLGGHGYKSLGSIYHKRSKKLERLWFGFTRPSYDTPLLFDLWLGRGSLPSPYLRGLIIEYLRRVLRPRDLQMVPDLYSFECEIEFLERTMFRQWLKQWLSWVSWYHLTAWASDPILVDLLLSCPIVEISWRRRTCNQELVRFGHLWKIFDMVGRYGVHYRPGILPMMDLPFAGWIYGGKLGKDFMMAPLSRLDEGVS